VAGGSLGEGEKGVCVSEGLAGPAATGRGGERTANEKRLTGGPNCGRWGGLLGPAPTSLTSRLPQAQVAPSGEGGAPSPHTAGQRRTGWSSEWCLAPFNAEEKEETSGSKVIRAALARDCNETRSF